MIRKFALAFALALLLPAAFSRADQATVWEEGATVPTDGRPNPYGFSADELQSRIQGGRIDALEYPVSVTGILIPYEPIRQFVEDPQGDFLHWLLQFAFRKISGISSMGGYFAMLGLHPYPDSSDAGVYAAPYPDGVPPHFRMGVTLVRKNGVEGLTISCAACHSANLFGKRVLGMTNRFSKANLFYLKGKEAMDFADGDMFRDIMRASDDEVAMYNASRDNIRFVHAKAPAAPGLDTSLAQVALSLARRAQDPYATKDPAIADNPRPDLLDDFVADGKPSVWWNIKYKDRWLSDGSVVSGNPIFTNFLWNEIGRGGDLHDMDSWLGQNGNIIADLTTAVFASEAPRYTDFFPADKINLDEAQAGQGIFDARCARCHGHYDKKWDLPNAASLPYIEQLETLHVRYPQQTPVVNVGTDPNRAIGMKSLETALNPLAISQQNGIVIRTQLGYVPPPLVGIWARWPYFHNNSVPSLCAVLTRSEDRPVTYVAGEANNPDRDFDDDCVGYPTPDRAPDEWNVVYDTTQPGMSNSGHDEGIFLEQGQELLTPDEKHDLIEFLKTL